MIEYKTMHIKKQFIILIELHIINRLIITLYDGI